MENNFEIIDNDSVIHSGTEEEMLKAWFCMTRDVVAIMEEYGIPKAKAVKLYKEYYTGWSGDLKLIQVINIYR